MTAHVPRMIDMDEIPERRSGAAGQLFFAGPRHRAAHAVRLRIRRRLQRGLHSRRGQRERDQLPVFEGAGNIFQTAGGDDSAIHHQYADAERGMRRIGELPAMRRGPSVPNTTLLVASSDEHFREMRARQPAQYAQRQDGRGIPGGGRQPLHPRVAGSGAAPRRRADRGSLGRSRGRHQGHREGQAGGARPVRDRLQLPVPTARR